MAKVAIAHYSGSESEDFWKRVGDLKDQADHAALYALGCALQNLESYVLQQLVNAEVEAKIKRGRKPATKKKRH
jgi:hypothetical protein